ncbi:hypothetical protein BCR32DRAFT_291797 [Anaeromyces robustus]|uniref:Uncharacterized protein n=1 Tax=Anaeromyces robustus TaxID=1754192 RepID=A0A1Y1XD79_9FUNG|nr:hypothetical protein BCR32DRAFT_291797 [Anaeromyces robustus]|eukprot:ORX83730.1 hypothetical protein BCR32DRAFT_291797 [Anaeromyces robustus]
MIRAFKIVSLLDQEALVSTWRLVDLEAEYFVGYLKELKPKYVDNSAFDIIQSVARDNKQAGILLCKPTSEVFVAALKNEEFKNRFNIAAVLASHLLPEHEANRLILKQPIDKDIYNFPQMHSVWSFLTNTNPPNNPLFPDGDASTLIFEKKIFRTQDNDSRSNSSKFSKFRIESALEHNDYVLNTLKLCSSLAKLGNNPGVISRIFLISSIKLAFDISQLNCLFVLL